MTKKATYGPNGPYVKGYVSKAEHAEAVSLAKQAGLTLSEYVRRCTLGRTLPNIKLHESIIELSKTNGDLARLGNLFMLALNDEDLETPDGLDLHALLTSIRDTQDTLKAKIKELKTG